MARPVEFERETVLQNAMETFWEHGYCATSMSQLVDITGLKPGSIYAAFGSKEGLFLSTIDHYGQASLKRLQACMAQADNPLDGLRHYLEMLIAEARKDTKRRGCFLVNTILEVAPHNPGVKERVSSYLDRIEAVFHDNFNQAIEAGMFASNKSAANLARKLMITIWGIRVLSRIQDNRMADDDVLNELMIDFFS